MTGILGVVVVLGLAFGLLLWLRQNPYVVTRTEMKEAMERVLSREMPSTEWQKLLHTPIKRDRYLNSVREKLVALPQKDSPADAAEFALYDSTELSQISTLRDALVRRGL